MTKKIDASSINTNDIPRPNMFPLTPKAIRLKGKHMIHHKQQCHMYTITCILINKIYVKHNINLYHRFDSIAQGCHFTRYLMRIFLTFPISFQNTCDLK